MLLYLFISLHTCVHTLLLVAVRAARLRRFVDLQINCNHSSLFEYICNINDQLKWIGDRKYERTIWYYYGIGWVSLPQQFEGGYYKFPKHADVIIQHIPSSNNILHQYKSKTMLTMLAGLISLYNIRGYQRPTRLGIPTKFPQRGTYVRDITKVYPALNV